MNNFPYRLRVTDIEKIKKLQRIKENGYVRSDLSFNTWFGIHLKPIRRAFHVGPDYKTGELGISTKFKELQIEFKPAYGKRKGMDVWFKL